MTFSIAGKTAIVTGAAHGVGLAIARRFVTEGANVVFADRDEDALRHEVDALPSDTEGQVRLFAGDLREKLSIANLLSLTHDAFDRVDILINGSRQVLRTDPFDPDDGSVMTLLEQNMLTALRLSQATAKRMIKQSEDDDPDTPAGSIVNLSSIAAERAHPELLAYSISSAALNQLTRSLAVAYAPKRIRVNAVAFGSVMSASLKDSLRDDRDLRDRIVKNTPLNRIASPNELSDAVQYLASDGAGFVTGQVLTVDGGRNLLDPAAASAH